jgi:predicted DNA-binding protein
MPDSEGPIDDRPGRLWGKLGIAILTDWYFHGTMKTLTMKLPEELLGWLETEAKRAGQPKSALVREILQRHQQRQHQSALELAGDLCGCARSGLRDLARNKKYLRGFGR